MIDFISNNIEGVKLLSLGLTVPTISIGIGVLLVFTASAYRGFISKERSDRDYFIMGVWSCFLGLVLDNLFWQGAWTADYLAHNSQVREGFFKYGVVSNIPFRLIANIIGGYYHLRATMVSDSGVFKWSIWGGWILGLAYMAVVWGIKNGMI